VIKSALRIFFCRCRYLAGREYACATEGYVHKTCSRHCSTVYSAGDAHLEGTTETNCANSPCRASMCNRNSMLSSWPKWWVCPENQYLSSDDGNIGAPAPGARLGDIHTSFSRHNFVCLPCPAEAASSPAGSIGMDSCSVACDAMVDCSRNGRCQDQDGSCICDHGWTGPSCNQSAAASPKGDNQLHGRACKRDDYSGSCSVTCDAKVDCSRNGRCQGQDGSCICDHGWTGPSCNQSAAASPTPDNRLHGRACKRDDYSGSCSVTCDAKVDCSRNGRCQGQDGSCICDHGWTGPSCNQSAVNGTNYTNVSYSETWEPSFQFRYSNQSAVNSTNYTNVTYWETWAPSFQFRYSNQSAVNGTNYTNVSYLET
jgi:hypothetical protein